MKGRSLFPATCKRRERGRGGSEVKGRRKGREGEEGEKMRKKTTGREEKEGKGIMKGK